MKNKKIELLAPAGSFGALVAGCESGADAVYLGGQRFNARAGANNFSDEELAEAVRYAHVRGVKVYITLNTLLAEDELAEAMGYVDFLYRIDIDALILQDIGLAGLIKKRYPDFELHGSTQMTVHDLQGALLLKEMGFSRIVAARELSVGDIKALREESGLELEVFVHGALCVSWSGQCLLSSFIGGRSGNRGRCAQPCRRKYKRLGAGFYGENSSYCISTRDLNTLEHLEEILDSGAASLKLEGRMKNPEYVGITVANYRKALDYALMGRPMPDMEEAQYELTASFNREFTAGYLLGEGGHRLVNEERPDNRGIFIGRVISQKGNFLRIKLEESFVCDGDGIEIEGADGYSGVIISGMNVNAKPGKKAKAGDTAEVFTGRTFEVGSRVRKTLDSELQKKAQTQYMEKNQKKIELSGCIRLRVGEVGSFRVWDEDGNLGMAKTPEPIQEAAKKPASMESLQSNLEKTGDTPFRFIELKGDIEGNCFMPVSVVNELRRSALAELEEKRSRWHTDRVCKGIEEAAPSVTEEKPEEEKETTNEKKHAHFICRVESLEQAFTCLEAGATAIDIKWDSFLRENPGDKKKNLSELREAGALGLWSVLPNIVKTDEGLFLEELKKLCQEKVLDGIVANGIGMVHWARENGLPYRAGSSLNIFNQESGKLFSDSMGIQPSEEMTLVQLKHLKSALKDQPVLECKVFGKSTAMTLEYCPFERENCREKCSVLKGAGLEDNTGRFFPLRRSLGHRIQLLNSSTLLIYKELSSFEKNGLFYFILDFTDEPEELIYDTVKCYLNPEDRNSGELPKKIGESMENGDVEYTKGHYFRGVI